MMNDLFQCALGITSPWFIKSINFDKNLNHLDIEVDFKRGATFVDDSEDVDTRKRYTAYDTVDRTWRHLIFQYACLHARVPRIKRNDGYVRMISPPWSGVVSGFTLLFESAIDPVLQSNASA